MQSYIGVNIITLTLAMLFGVPTVYAQQMNLELSPNASKVITNHYGWTLSATCTIQTTTKNTIRVSILDNKGTVNGRNLNVGQVMSLVVNNHDSLSVSAEPGTKVTLQNLSHESIQATCST